MMRNARSSQRCHEDVGVKWAEAKSCQLMKKYSISKWKPQKKSKVHTFNALIISESLLNFLR